MPLRGALERLLVLAQVGAALDAQLRGKLAVEVDAHGGLAAETDPACSSEDGSAKSDTYPCTCGTATCIADERCTSSTNTCADPVIRCDSWCSTHTYPKA